MSRYSDALQDAAESARLVAASSIDPMWASAHGVSGPASLMADADPSSDAISVHVVPHGSFASFGRPSQPTAAGGTVQASFTVDGAWHVAAAGDGVGGAGPTRREDYRVLGAGLWNPLSAACARSLELHRDAIRSALLADALERTV